MFKPTILTLALLLAGCATLEAPQAPAGSGQMLPEPLPEKLASSSAIAVGESSLGADAASDVRAGAAETRLFLGTDQMIRQDLAPQVDPVLTEGDKVSLNFENVSVESLVAALLGDLLKVSYTIDAGAGTTVSLRTRQPLERREVLDVLDTVLLPHDLVIIRDNAGVYHLTSRSATAGSQPFVSASNVKDLVGSGTVIVPLNHIGAAEMAKILKPLAPADAIVNVDTLRNLIMLRGSKSQLTGWLELVDTFDIDYLSGMSLGVFPLEYANVNTVYDTLRTMMGADPGGGVFGSDSGSAQDEGQRSGRAAPASQSQAVASDTGAGGPLDGLVRLFPIERLNALVVVSPRKQILGQVETWIRRLDQPTDALEAGLFVYPVQNGSAVRMAELLNGLFGTGAAPGGAGVAGGSAPSQFGSSRNTRQSGSSSDLSRSSRQAGGSGLSFGLSSASFSSDNGAPATSVSDLEGNVRVVADESRNALLIRAPRTEYRRIERALRDLDRAPTQVLIEASIVEVGLTGDLKYGVEWFLQNSLGGGHTGEARFNTSGSGDGGLPQTGFSYSIVNRAGQVRATLNALAEKSLLRILSNPSVLVLDNHNAKIQIGNEQPIRTGDVTVVDGAVISDTFSYKDTGVMLSVRPSVNSGGLITMDILQQVVDVGEIDAATEQRSFLTREIESRVAVRSGETIVLGGMIRENESSGRSGIPVLGDIPVLGAAFSTTAKTRERTELIVLLTPRALEDDDQLRAVSRELRDRMRGLDLQSLPSDDDFDSGKQRSGVTAQ